MKNNFYIKIIKKPDVTDLAGEKVMINFDTGKYYILTGSANEIWDMIEEGATTESIITSLLDIFEVEEEVCRGEVVSFLKQLESIGFISLENV